MDDAEEEVEAPSPARVQRRAVVLATVSCRGIIEAQAADDWVPKFHLRILDWLPSADLEEELEPEEAALLRTPLGTLTLQKRVNASWRAEGLAVLAWALGCYPLPAFNEQVDPKAAASSVGFLSEDAASRAALAALRPEEDLLRARELIFALHWRLREFSLRPKATDFAAVGRQPWMGMGGIRQLPLVSGDLALGGIPLAETDESIWRPCLSIAQERHLAINWIFGQETLYSDVTGDT
jgi:hypothetical protein